jgi:hypothetical protein
VTGCREDRVRRIPDEACGLLSTAVADEAMTLSVDPVKS